jgi:hypothetical protein
MVGTQFLYDGDEADEDNYVYHSNMTDNMSFQSKCNNFIYSVKLSIASSESMLKVTNNDYIGTST